MKVILLKELQGRGGEGDVIEVANGFANNYLFPNNIAIRATAGNLKQLEQRRTNIAKREEKRLADSAALKETLEGATILVEAQIGEEGQLFGSVTSIIIAEAIAEQLEVEIDRRKIDLGQVIKTAGDHEVIVSIYREIKATLKVSVVPEGTKAALEAQKAAEAEAEAEAETAAE